VRSDIQKKGKERSMNWQVKELESEVTSWPGVTAHSHRFAGREFRVGDAEIGHVHVGGVVDIPYSRALRDALLAAGLAEQHRWVPDSGWTTFHVRSKDQMQHAIWLMRLSYARYAIKKSEEPQKSFEQESMRLGLQEPLLSLLRKFVRSSAVDGGSLLESETPVPPATQPRLSEDARK
jgi:luciferase-like monooxygenase